MFGGQKTRGGVLSRTVTVNEQLGPAPVVQVTVVAPTAKKDPDGGAQLTAPQTPDVVGEG
jgi:hypothetical protein